MEYLLAFLGAFCVVFLKGFQHKNVINNLYLPTFLTSYAMMFTEVLFVGLIARNGWTIAFVAATGAAFAMVAAMYIHNRFMKKEPKVKGLVDS
jgi:hypothetical protein